ncbi:hypothetical protein BDR26DRAFT_866478 [Obelidium mucronatum]|nr:hypothetical protein BDR26DRAFT_866478 [Obelidium mucronatum]
MLLLSNWLLNINLRVWEKLLSCFCQVVERNSHPQIACRLGSETLVGHLLKTGGNRSMDSSFGFQYSFGLQSSFGFQYRNDDCNALIRMAAECGHEKIVKMLLDDKHVDPSARSLALTAFKALLQALTGKPKPEVVSLLLADDRVDPTAFDNLALAQAVSLGSAENLMLLLADPRVDPNIAIQKAADAGNHANIAALLADERVNPTANNNYAISAAVKYGSFESVRLLLKDERVDPSVNDNEPLRRACQRGNMEMVQLLLTCPKMASPANCLVDAAKVGNTEIFKVLLADKRVDLVAEEGWVLNELRALQLDINLKEISDALADMEYAILLDDRIRCRHVEFANEI